MKSNNANVRRLEYALKGLLFSRRSEHRQRAFRCDPEGDLSIAGAAKPLDGPRYEYNLQLSSMSAQAATKTSDFVFSSGDFLSDIAADFGAALVVEPEERVTHLDFVSRSATVYFSTISGRQLAFTTREDEFHQPVLIAHLASSNAIAKSFPHCNSPIFARELLYQFAMRARARDVASYSELMNAQPQFKTGAVGTDWIFTISFGNAREESKLGNLKRVLSRGVENDDASSLCDDLWRVLRDCYEDRDSQFARSCRVVRRLNLIVRHPGSRGSQFSRATRDMLQDAQSHLGNEYRRFIDSLNASDLEWIENWIDGLCCSIRASERDDDKELQRQRDEAFNDTRLNRFGVSVGQMNRLRYELSEFDGGPNSKLLRRLVWQRDQSRCQHCGSKRMGIRELEDQSLAFEIDHIVPLARGGTNDLSNLQLLCYSCNSLKGVRLESEYPERARLAFYKYASFSH
jgi:5-methylcytosine-specific restriction protein A